MARQVPAPILVGATVGTLLTLLLHFAFRKDCLYWQSTCSTYHRGQLSIHARTYTIEQAMLTSENCQSVAFSTDAYPFCNMTISPKDDISNNVWHCRPTHTPSGELCDMMMRSCLFANTVYAVYPIEIYDAATETVVVPVAILTNSTVVPESGVPWNCGPLSGPESLGAINLTHSQVRNLLYSSTSPASEAVQRCFNHHHTLVTKLKYVYYKPGGSFNEGDNGDMLTEQAYRDGCNIFLTKYCSTTTDGVLALVHIWFQISVIVTVLVGIVWCLPPHW